MVQKEKTLDALHYLELCPEKLELMSERDEKWEENASKVYYYFPRSMKQGQEELQQKCTRAGGASLPEL